MNPDERRRKRQALNNTGQQATQGQYGEGGGWGMGFTPPAYPGPPANPPGNDVPPQNPPGGGGVSYWPRRQPNFSHQQLAGNYQQGIGNSVDTRHNVQMFQGKVVGNTPPPQAQGQRYGQQQGFGEGYRQPRRSLGDQHRTALQRTAASAGRGYNPRTSAQMYGGRPQGQPQPRQMNQAQAMTRPSFGSTAYVGRPFGGTNAVTRRRW